MLQFNSLATSEIALGNMKITATVIGASHVLSVSRNGEEIFHEILACVKPKECSDGVVLTRSLDQMPLRYQVTNFGDARYQFLSWSLAWGEETSEKADELLAAAKRQDVWQSAYFEFPKGDLPHVPATIVLLRKEAIDKLLITTAHSYPGQALVISRSTITNEQ